MSSSTMNRQRFTVALIGLASFGWSALAHAKDEFPGQIQRNLSLTYEPPCSVCHSKGNVGSATPITPFALSLRSRGLSGDNNSVSTSLTKLKADNVDSDGDGVTDIDELTAGSDPNSSANSSINGDQEAGYGCGGKAPTGHSGPGVAGVLALGWFLLRRRRGQL